MSKSKQKKQNAALAQESAVSHVTSPASSPSSSPSASSSSSSSARSAKSPKASSAAASAAVAKLPYPFPAGITNADFAQPYISPKNKSGRLARKAYWLWNIHAVSAMFDPFEIIILNTTAIAISAAMGYYAYNTVATLF